VTRLSDLDAYVTGEMTDADADAFEEALFDAPDDADVALVDRLSRHGAQLVAHGTFDIGVTRTYVDSLVAAGHIVQVLDIGPPGRGTIALDRDAELVVTKLHLGRTDVERVDVEITVVDHGVTKVIKDVLVDPSDGIVYGMCERPLAEIAFGAGRTITRVRRSEGARDVLGQWDLSPA
jgi:hypothetical protein